VRWTYALPSRANIRPAALGDKLSQVELMCDLRRFHSNVTLTWHSSAGGKMARIQSYCNPWNVGIDALNVCPQPEGQQGFPSIG
jgi:hypothetical protein